MLREAATAVFTGEPVAAAYLFGSRARGDERPDSDADVAVLLDGTVPPHDRLDLSLRLAGALSRAVRLDVSPLVVLDDAPLRLQGRVLRDGVVIFVSDDDMRVRYETTTRSSAADYEIVAERLDRELLAAHARGDR